MFREDVQDYVREACESKENIFGPSFFTRHVMVVAHCAVELAQRLHGDEEIVEVASFLHDISAVLDPSTMPAHPKCSASIATEFLRGLNYPESRIDQVGTAIESHTEPIRREQGSIETVCLSNADAMSRILEPAYWLYFAIAVRKLEFEAAREWLRSLVERQWRLMIPEARELSAERYRGVLSLLA
jgi:uncharacterized protein